MLRLGVVAILFITAIAQAGAQSKTNLSQKYASMSTYQLRPGIIMFVEFDKHGQACQMTIEKNRIGLSSEDDEDRNDTLSVQLADEIVDEVVPASVRGQPLSKYLDPDSYVAGGVFVLKHDYSNVSIEKSGYANDGSTGGIRLLRIAWTKRSCVRASKSSSTH